MKQVEQEKDEFQEEFEQWKQEQERNKTKKSIKQNLAKFQKKRQEMVDMYVETINKFGPEHRVAKIYFSMLKFYEKMYEVVEELVTVQQALIAIDDLNYIMENTFKSMDLILNSKYNNKRTSGFYRWRQNRKISKYVRNCYKRLETAQAVGDRMVKSIDKVNFTGKKKEELTGVNEEALNNETRNMIAQAQAKYNGQAGSDQAPSQSGPTYYQGPTGGNSSSTGAASISGEAGNVDDIFKD